jgi:hypothetical protein
MNGYFLNDKYTNLMERVLSHPKTKLVIKSIDASNTGLNDQNTV